VDLGKRIRLRRLITPETGTSIICALDHGMTSPTFLSGLTDTRARAREAIAGGANVLMLSRGMAAQVVDELQPQTSFALMLSASAAGRPGGSLIAPIGSVEEALRLGADAVVVYVALAGDDEHTMISYTSEVAEACQRLGMPFIAEAEYPNAYERLDQMESDLGADYLLRNARLCAELGADIVKVNWSGDETSFAEIVRACGVPVVVAGGSLIADEELLTRCAQAAQAGAAGCSVGRNIFQHDSPTAITRAICRVMRDGWSVDDALHELREDSARLATADRAATEPSGRLTGVRAVTRRPSP
jgi:DhnA family fructose-bisphosphate aldolase class Ia